MSYISRVLRLTLLAPDTVEAILGGPQPEAMALPTLTQLFPVEWVVEISSIAMQRASPRRNDSPLLQSSSNGSAVSLPKLATREIEAANRAEATALLIRARFRVYRPEADVTGEDLVLRWPDGRLRAVQLKGRPAVDRLRYSGRNIWMLFPDPYGNCPGRNWFLVDHDEFYSWVENRHGRSPKWEQSWSYSYITKALGVFLAPYCHIHWSSQSTAADITVSSAATSL
ncbi:hypothetical protein [Roseomonas fluvialis]|uniref:hypothetical protein n=1 Tax=Roseomonas fluvialis TaxID=1750527 RepID=UPI001FCA5490|nr:hypothetical protein [Roseomonas fluvialis]